MNQAKIEIDNSNMIPLIASPDFYGDEDVYLRELLQNAYDACMTRRAFEMSWGTEFLEYSEAHALNSIRKLFEPKISISYSSLSQRLSIEDNGIGMNDHDMERYVSKIGCSYYASEEFAHQQLKYEPVGHFGIGLLSCFMVSRGIMIESKKDACVNTAWNISSLQSLEPVTAKWFENTGEVEYIYSNREESGSRVTLALKPKYAARVSQQGLVRLVRKYMLCQPFPIEIDFDDRRTVLEERNTILDNPFADVLGIVSIPLADEDIEGYIWLYPSKYREMFGISRLYQQGFWVADGLELKPEWVRDMTYQLHIKTRFFTLRASRDNLDCESFRELRELIGQKIVDHFARNPIGLNQYLGSGKGPVISEYEEEAKLLAKAVMVDVFLKGREISLSIETILHGFRGKVVRIAFIPKALFDHYSKNYFSEFRRFLKENRLIVFDRNRDIFCQFLAPYRKTQRYVISEYPGILYEDMVADFQIEKNVILYRNSYSLRPPKLGYEDIFCIVLNQKSETLQLLVNEEHRLYQMLEPVMYEPKVHRMLEVILENIKQRILNSQKAWDKIVDFGGSIVDEWNQALVPSVQSVWCLESDFAVSVNEFILKQFSKKELVELGLVGLEFHRDDFISWWYMPKE
ncbi:MAG: ATP-binding protein [Muribaculaceae bacterium]|nr:ATP-binding protein [Roseburia sp.]MCM1431370.1 ATP-binding protein [Muribaculaceae bacterium]MCM1491812.1 ATP-binding protein [Muribaculaceae bacterium]